MADQESRTQDVSVSAVMPCLNGEPFVAAAVESIFRQTRSPDEVVLLDNGSTDSTRDIFEDFATKHANVRVVGLQSSIGPIESTNRALSEARSDIVVLFHHDDISREDRIETQLRYIDDGVAVVGSFMDMIDVNGVSLGVLEFPTNNEQFLKEMHRRNVVALPSVLILREAFESVGRLRVSAGFGADYDLWLRLLEAGFVIRTVPEPLVQYRMHEGQGSAQDDPNLLWCKFEVLLSAACRSAGKRDPLATTDACEIDHFVRELGVLKPDAREFVEVLRSRLRAGGIDIEGHRILRDAALSVLDTAENVRVEKS